MSGRAVVAAARGWLGTPYRHQASLKGVGCDCLGLARGVWREVVGPEPEPAPAYPSDWAGAARGAEPLLDAARRRFVAKQRDAVAPGDLLVFRWRPGLPASHLGIATARDAMIHAQDGACVAEVALNDWWRRRLVAVFAFPVTDRPEPLP
jgi:NlpC/P60 family putative phage cell wall peptidase